ncbi:MAG: hypothetical protein M1416_00845 [Candidatus Pacearchaeota archaeon]|nr:hypothetical protein [Candidatus Pacearchaeota archaeon]
MNHPDKIEGYNGTLEDLAKEVGNMSYDKTAEFIGKMASNIAKQADEDFKKGKIKLALQLYKTANNLYSAKKEIDLAWKICEPYMKNSNQD